MPRLRTVIVLLVTGVALSTGGRWYRDRAASRLRAAATAAPPKAQLRIGNLIYSHTPLRDVIADIQSRSGVGIVVDWQALRAAGVTPDAPVEARLGNATWHKALAISLDYVRSPGYGQALVVEVTDKGSVLVTSERQGFQRAYIEPYDLRDPAGAFPWPDPPRLAWYEAEVEGLLTDAVAPDSWVHRGGPYGRCRVRHGWVVTFQTPEHQRSIQQLLDGLHEVRGLTPVEREKARLLSRLRGENPAPEAGDPR